MREPLLGRGFASSRGKFIDEKVKVMMLENDQLGQVKAYETRENHACVKI